ncbi:acyltransferase family protein [Cellulosimicrobium funkei]|uniref:acyltransferase family protein n=1 Tax=Cellulosimicrobium funkei TaxID=264251 RepID=UPI0036FD3A0B
MSSWSGPVARMPRADSLTGLRWWAAFGVFCYHMANFAPLPVQAVFDYGNFGVTFFFVLSGFVLTWAWSSATPATTFWWRRVARIYPAHLVALALAIPVFYSVSPDPEQWWVKPFGAVLLLSIPLLQGWSRDPSVLFSGNPAAWTLTCEAFFYALHPALQRPLLAVRTRGALLFAAGTIVVALTYRTAAMGAPGSWWSSGLPWPVVRLSEFFLGMCLAWAVRSGWRLRLRPWFGYAAALGLVGLLIVCRTPAAPASVARWVNGSANELAMVVCALMIVLVAVRDLAGRPSLLRTRPLVALGNASYAFYLVHATVLYALLALVGHRSEGWANLGWYAVTFALSLALALALHHGVEAPVERRMRRWWDARRARRQPPTGPVPSPGVTMPQPKPTTV